MSKINPVERRILIRLDPVEQVTAGGIIRPDTSHERSQMAQTEATVVSVGPNAFDDWGLPVPVPGDRVLIAKYGGQAPKSGEESLERICDDSDVVAIMEEVGA